MGRMIIIKEAAGLCFHKKTSGKRGGKKVSKEIEN
ncbi:hypothetical protein SAMN04488168_13621 [Bacillus sp. 491mf]|nr:hypothetical protein SAMN04488168_13621 [Bacillus sp. 491mf]